MTTHKGLLCIAVLVLSLTVPGLQPTAEAFNCTVDVDAVFLGKWGKLSILARTATGALPAWTLCNLVSGSANLSAESCSAYYSMTLTARSLETPVRLVMDNAALSDAVAARGVSWDGTCEGIVSWTYLEAAIKRIDLM